MVYPCASMKYLHHIIMPRTSAMLASSAYVKIPTFNLCFVEILTITPFHIDIMAPVYTVSSQWTPYDAFTYSNWGLIY